MVGYILYNLWIIARAETIKYREITAYLFRKAVEGLIKGTTGGPGPPE